MKTVAAMLLLLLAVGGFAPRAGAAEEAVYPGAKAEEMAAPAGMGQPPGSKIRYYLSDAPFEAVLEFYQKRYKELPTPEGAMPPLPDGQKVRVALFSLDGKGDITESAHILKVQRPFIGGAKPEGGRMRYIDVRDLTVIHFIRTNE